MRTPPDASLLQARLSVTIYALQFCTMSPLNLQLVPRIHSQLASQCWQYTHKLANCPARSQKDLPNEYVSCHLSSPSEHQAKFEAILMCRSYHLCYLQLPSYTVAFPLQRCLLHGVRAQTLKLSGSHWLLWSCLLPCARSSPGCLP